MKSIYSLYLFLILCFFASSSMAISNEYKLLEWECLVCKWSWYGDNPPHTQRCFATKKDCHIWILKHIFIFPEKSKRSQLTSLAHTH